MGTVTAGLARFYHEIAGVGLVFPRESSLGWTPLDPPNERRDPPSLVARIVPPLANYCFYGLWASSWGRSAFNCSLTVFLTRLRVTAKPGACSLLWDEVE